MRCTSISIERAVASLYGFDMPNPAGRSSRGARVTGPSSSLMPQRVTICRARALACWMSSSPQPLGRDLLVHDTGDMVTARLPRRVVLAAAIAGLGLGPRLLGSRVRAAADEQLVAPRYRLLVLSRTAGFRHESIPDAVAAVR